MSKKKSKKLFLEYILFDLIITVKNRRKKIPKFNETFEFFFQYINNFVYNP